MMDALARCAMARLALLLACINSSVALLFQSHRVSSQWDTWAVCANDTYHAFFLSNVTAPSQGLGTPYDGAAHAVSADGVHFADHGEAWRLPALPGLCDGEWRCTEGTGSVFVRPNDRSKRKRFSINYSICRNNDKGELVENISFAESDDLEHFAQVMEDGAPLLFGPDARYYRDSPSEAAPTVRWDTITGFVPGDEPGEVFGYWTASPLADEDAAFGMGATSDGLHWRALPPPKVIWATAEGAPVPPLGGGVEVGGVAEIGGRYFLLGGAGWKMHALVAESPFGPFRPTSKNYEVLSGAGYFTRFFEGCDGALLVSHQAFHLPNHFLAPYKAASLDADGALRLSWWAGNDGLAGARIETWEREPLDLARGVVLEGALDLRGAPSPANASDAAKACLPGFEFALTDGGATLVLFVDGEGRGVTGVSTPGAAFAVYDAVDRELPAAPTRFRLLVRASMVELYVGDVFLVIESAPWRTRGRAAMAGVVARTACAARRVRVESAREMTLPPWVPG